jgi:UDP:flavonoid glycosyltransferase YjiC (YdhE family)
MSAIAAGVPQVVMPLFSLDQQLNAEHVEAVGAGLALRSGPDDVGQLPAAVRRLLAGTPHRAAAREVAAHIAQLPVVSEMVPELEKIAAGSGPGPEPAR